MVQGMALVSGEGSGLNPNAAPFIPAAISAVEDFSPEWWDLVQTSAWFRNYWLSQHQDVENFDGNADEDVVNLLPDSFDLGIDEEFTKLCTGVDGFVLSTELEADKISALTARKKEYKRRMGLKVDAVALLNKLNASKTSSTEYPMFSTKYAEKAVHHMNPRHVPRRILQPR